MRTSGSKVLPFGGSIDVSNAYRDVKTVDRSNPNAKFSKRSAPRGTESTVFDTASTEVTPSRGVRIAPRHSDPFQSEQPPARPTGVRITKMDESQKAREDFQFNHPRQSKKSCPAPAQQDNSNVRFTAFGASYVGKAVPVHTNKESQDVAPARDEKCLERFKLTPRPTTNVLLPHTLQDTTPKAKPQRFQQSTRHNESLVGVLKPSLQQTASSYRVTAPWFTE